jgi:hypothetical protein
MCCNLVLKVKKAVTGIQIAIELPFDYRKAPLIVMLDIEQQGGSYKACGVGMVTNGLLSACNKLSCLYKNGLNRVLTLEIDVVYRGGKQPISGS